MLADIFSTPRPRGVILDEAQYAPLYHFTNLYALGDIAATDRLGGSKYQWRRGVSLTRDPRHPWSKSLAVDAVLVLNQDRLRQDFSLVPVRGDSPATRYDPEFRESEERVYTSIVPLHRYLLGIYVGTDMDEHDIASGTMALNRVRRYAERHNIPLREYEDFSSRHGLVESG